MILKSLPVTRKSKDIRIIKDVYYSSFPKSEQAPFWFLLMRAKKGNVVFRAYYDDDALVGLAYLVLQGNLTFVVYIAVCQDKRSMGYGSQILKQIKESYPGNRIILTIEMANEKAKNNEQREMRKKFYEKNGYAASGIIVEQRGDVFELLVHGGSCSAEDFEASFKKFIGTFIFAFAKPKLRDCRNLA